MFSLRNFVQKTVLGMVGNEPDYKVMQYALGWYDRGTLTEEDLVEVGAAIELKNTPPEPELPEPTPEEPEVTE